MHSSQTHLFLKAVGCWCLSCWCLSCFYSVFANILFREYVHILKYWASSIDFHPAAISNHIWLTGLHWKGSNYPSSLFHRQSSTDENNFTTFPLPTAVSYGWKWLLWGSIGKWGTSKNLAWASSVFVQMEYWIYLRIWKCKLKTL